MARHHTLPAIKIDFHMTSPFNEDGSLAGQETPEFPLLHRASLRTLNINFFGYKKSPADQKMYKTIYNRSQ
jgi:hypothetical protein